MTKRFSINPSSHFSRCCQEGRSGFSGPSGEGSQLKDLFSPLFEVLSANADFVN